jgi:hypothetical protein
MLGIKAFISTHCTQRNEFMLENMISGKPRSNIHKQFLVHTKYSKFAKEVMNIYFIFSHKTETVVLDSESLRVLVLKSICLATVLKQIFIS